MSIEKISQPNSVSVFLVVIYSVGLIGLNVESLQGAFRSATPINLLLTASLLIYFHQQSDKNLFWFIVAAFGIGFGVEVLGVKTGFPFGGYYYLGTLGPKVFEVPPMIGINWFLLIYICGIFAADVGKNSYEKAFFGAFLMIMLDFQIEPFAMRHLLWNWYGNGVPLENYLAWYVIAFGLLLLFFKLVPAPKNPIAKPVFWILLLFFTVDNVLSFLF